LGLDSTPAPPPPPPAKPAKGTPAKSPTAFDFVPESVRAEVSGPIGMAVALVLYVVFSSVLFLVARKTDTALPWLAFLPIANLYTAARCAVKVWWRLILVFISLVNIALLIVVFLGIAT
jgi:hypothetical protein